MTGWFGTPPDPGAPAPVPVTVIGYDGSPLSPQAREALAAAHLVVGGRRHLEAAGVTCRTAVLGPVEPALEQIDQAYRAGDRVVVLASGDPGVFGVVRRLTQPFGPRVAVTVLPAVSSVAGAFARLGVPWDDAVVVSAHGRPLGPALNVIRRFGHGPRRVAVLTDADSSPARIVEALGEDCPDLHVFENLGTPDERHWRIVSVLPEAPEPGMLGHEEAVSRGWESPNLVVTSWRRSDGATPWLAGHRDGHGRYGDLWAQPDEEFEHRDGMLTKREVRAVVLARLAPAVGQLVWDVGAGSGSVAVECARLGAAVIAVEKEQAALEHIAANENDHQVRLKVVHGEAPDALKDLPHPDAVFVGGGGPDVVLAVAAVRPQRVVVALATLERVGPTIAALEGYDVDTVLLQVQHLTPLGDGHRLSPANPVFLVSGVLP